MNHDEPTDAQLEELLGTYAEALYQSSVVPDGEQEQPASDGITVTNTNQKAKPMESNPEQEPALVVNLQERPDGAPARARSSHSSAGSWSQQRWALGQCRSLATTTRARSASLRLPTTSQKKKAPKLQLTTQRLRVTQSTKLPG